jgi:hypothetical protein
MNIKRDNIAKTYSTVRPTEDDIGFGVPTLWLDTTGNKAYILVDVTTGVAKWTEIGGASAYDAQNSVLSIATAASVPPSETTGDRYILNGTPHANWDGAANKDIVEFDGDKWVATTPTEGMICEVEDVNTVYIYFTSWTAWQNQATLTTSSPTFAGTSLTDADVAHGMTTVAATDVFGSFTAISGTVGGLDVIGLTDATQDGALRLTGIIGAADPTDTHAAIHLRGGKVDGTGWTDLGAAETVLRLSNHEADLVTVLGSGNVGIGTTSPGSKLTVNGDVTLSNGQQITVGVYGTSGLQLIGETGVRALIGSIDSVPLIFRTASDEKMRITSTGNVGIGTTTGFGTSAAGELSMGVGTAPTTSPASVAQLWVADVNGVADKARFHTRTEDGVSSPLALQSEVEVLSNPKAMAQGVAMTAAVSGSSGITVADNDNLDMGTGNFTLVWRGSLPDWIPGASQRLFSKEDGDTTYTFIVLSTGVFRIFMTSTAGATANYDSSVANSLIDGTAHEICAAITRQTASVAGSVVFNVDGVQLGASVTITAATPGTVNNSTALELLGSNNASRFAGTLHSAYLINRAYTAAEVLNHYRNGLAESDKWGSQTAIANGAFVIGKRYRINTYVANDVFSNIDGVQGVNGYEFVATGTTATRYQDGSSVVAIGATLALDSESWQSDKPYDLSSNNLTCAYPATGWSLTRPATKRALQPTPTAETTGAVTLTLAKMLTGIITGAPSDARAYTLDTGANCDAVAGQFNINDHFDWTLINTETAANDHTITVTAASGHTIIGNPTVLSAHADTIKSSSGRFRTVKTAASTFISYRIA